MQVDFAAPIGYQEPAPKQEEPDLEDLMANKDELHDLERELDDSEDSYEEEKKSQFVPFGGSGSRISGKPINKGSNTLDALSKWAQLIGTRESILTDILFKVAKQHKPVVLIAFRF